MGIYKAHEPKKNIGLYPLNDQHTDKLGKEHNHPKREAKPVETAKKDK